MKNKIYELIKKFNTQPILFIGSGISRRYLGIEDWEGLLKLHAQMISGDELAYRGYESKAVSQENEMGLLPKIGQLIENDFNDKWFTDLDFREKHSHYTELVKNGASPFKAEISLYFSSHDIKSTKEEYKDELEKLQKISHKSVSAIITTNYDRMLESVFEGYETFIGQEALIFSDIKGVGEIYKIHGCCSDPTSIILTEKDYRHYNDRNSYLAAKILTLFLEHPIIFLGYSISDSDIESILKEIIKCLSPEKLLHLKDRLIFIEWDETGISEITSHAHAFEDGKSITLTKVSLSDFSELYNALLSNVGKYDIKVLRKLKSDIYDLVLTSNPVGKMKVVGLEDTRLEDFDVFVGVGPMSKFGEMGYSGLKANEIFKDIVLDDGGYDNQLITTKTLPGFLNDNSGKFPFYKYIRGLNPHYLPPVINDLIAKHEQLGYDSFLNATIIKGRHGASIETRSIPGITSEITELGKQISMICNLEHDEINLNDLEAFLVNTFKSNPSVLGDLTTTATTNLRRLVRIYDWMKYK